MFGLDKYTIYAVVNWAQADIDLSPRVKEYDEKKAIGRKVMFQGDALLTDEEQEMFDKFTVEIYFWLRGDLKYLSKQRRNDIKAI